MNEQLAFEQLSIFESEGFQNQFEPSQVENESEEDISNIGGLSFSDLAVTGTDWTVETIINQIRKGNIQLDPSFQRRDAWNNKVKSKFIESLFLGLPIPQIILAEHKDKKGKFIVIDGKQRLLSLKQFVLPDSNDKELKLSSLDILSQFNHMTYADIEQGMFYDDIDAFNNQTIRTVVIKNWKNVEILYLLFLRLNTGSVKLSPQELRQALYPGSFIEFVNDKSSESKELQKVLNIKKADFRMRDVEILIRYFAFHFFAKDYAGSMQDFLDSTCDKLNKSFESRRDEILLALKKFSNAINLTFQLFTDANAFRKFKGEKYEIKYNRAVIDIMLYYFSQVEEDFPSEKYKDNICHRFEALCSQDSNFLASLETTTKSTGAVHYRFKKWGETLIEITGKNFVIPTGY